MTDAIGDVAPERPRVIAGYHRDADSRTAIGQLNQTGIDLRAAIKPEVGEGGASGDRAGENCCVI